MGSLQLPGPGSGKTLTAGSGGNVWVVPTKAANKTLAEDFIGDTLRPTVQNLMGQSGGLSIAAQPSKITDPKAKALINTFNALVKSNGLALYPDWPCPGFYSDLIAGDEEIIGGTKSPSDVLTELGTPYQAFRVSVGKP